MQENLVIVESPAKAKTIEKFLGKEFMVKSSFGHIRDLSKKDLGIDMSNGFAPVYEIPKDKRKVVEELLRAAKGRTVWLASDEDREGEAIAWHLTEVLGLPVEQTRRIVFHEITKRAILEAVEHPRTVNMNLVNAQQARRVLDRLVGFELSPVLWKKVRPSLSAGRVQSVAVRLLVEREREIIAFKSTPYYRVVGQFYLSEADKEHTLLRAEAPTRDGAREAAETFLKECADETFSVVKVEEKPVQRYPAAPFTTSTLQQEAGRKLGMSVAQTMSVAQRLYEQGLITYMRTDSVNLSTLALSQCREEITKLYGEKYAFIHNYKTKTKGAQEAHEAIRPSYIDRQTIEGTATEKRLYELIWKRTVASQMVPAELDRTTIAIGLKRHDEQFVATGEVVRFDGFLRLYSESTDDETTEENDGLLPKLSVGNELLYDTIVATQRFTTPPARYNEASLVKRLEELGIGRPSTYAPTITTIINRGYVVKQSKEGQKRTCEQLILSGGKVTAKTFSESYGKEKNRLQPTDIGMVVNDYLEQQFAPIMDYNFTANVEKEFDRVADGSITWNKMIENFYGPFHKMVDKAIETQTDKNAQARVLGVDPATGHTVRARIGRYGPMVEIEGGPDEKPRYASMRKGQLIESITLDEALELFALPRTLGEYEGEPVVVGLSRYGAYVRWGKSTFASLEKEDDPHTLTLERGVELIRNSQAQKAAANTPIKTFDEDADMVVKNGRYGPYIAYKGKNYRIPKGAKPEELTLEECLKIVDTPKKTGKSKNRN